MENSQFQGNGERISGVNCKCGDNVFMYRTDTSSFPPRRYMVCGGLRQHSCGYFQWVDPIGDDDLGQLIPSLVMQSTVLQNERGQLMEEVEILREFEIFARGYLRDLEMEVKEVQWKKKILQTSIGLIVLLLFVVVMLINYSSWFVVIK